MNLQGKSQQGTTTDTMIHLKANVVRNLYKDALQKPILEERISILNERVANLQLLITTLEAKDSVRKESCEAQIASFQQEIALHQDQIKIMESMLRKEKRKRFWSNAALTLATGAAIYLSVTK